MCSSVKKITYWSPHINYVATVKAVYNSAASLKKYSNNKYEPTIIDAFGEWSEFYENDSKLNFYKLYNSKLIKKISSRGFFFSRIKYILIFIISSIPLTKYLLKKKPDYFIIHLITSLPLLLNYIFRFNSKIILRISGKPKMNFLRYIFWRITLKKIYKITFPTYETYEYFKNLNIVEDKKLYVLYDPVLNIKEISLLLKEKIEVAPDLDQYYICIGRLTKQKNFSFIINCFKNLSLNGDNSKLIILGNGEDYKKLNNQIKKNKLKNKVYLLGHRKNIFPYLKKSKAFILTSLWEDPGFVLLEAIYTNTFVISSDCSSGPKELISTDKGILFKNNSEQDFLKKLEEFNKLKKDEIKKMKIKAKKNCKYFTLFRHYKSLKNLFQN